MKLSRYLLATLALGVTAVMAGQAGFCQSLKPNAMNISTHNTDIKALIQKAEQERTAGLVDAAIADYDKVLQANPGNAYALASRGAARLVKHDAQGCIDDCTASLDIDKNDSFAWTWRGLSYLYSNRPEQAISDANEALNLDSKAELPYFIKGRAEIVLRDYQKAVQDFDSALTLNPESARNWFYGAIALENVGDLKNSETAWQKCTRLIPADGDAHYNLAVVAHKLGDRQLALSEVQQAAKIYKIQNQEQYLKDALVMIQELQQSA